MCEPLENKFPPMGGKLRVIRVRQILKRCGGYSVDPLDHRDSCLREIAEAVK